MIWQSIAKPSSHRPARARQKPSVFFTLRFSGSILRANSHHAHAPAQSFQRAWTTATSCATASSLG